MSNIITEKSSNIQQEINSSPLANVDWKSISDQAQKETRSRPSYLPPVSVFRWWARRSESVMSGIVEALEDHWDKESLKLCDPFAGGGTTGLAAARKGQSIHLQDLNHWATQGLKTMFNLPSSEKLKQLREKLFDLSSSTLKKAYETEEPDSGFSSNVAHTIRVRIGECPECDRNIKLYPNALVSLLDRKGSSDGSAWFACQSGHLFLDNREDNPKCPNCSQTIDPSTKYISNRTKSCPSCENNYSLDQILHQNQKWEIVLLETCLKEDGTRILRKPTQDEIKQADSNWNPNGPLPQIPEGRETQVLHRHGFRTWSDLYPNRQQFILEELLQNSRELTEQNSVERRTLETLIIGSAEMAGLSSRWDRFYLKNYEAMALHRFNFTTLSCEPNVWGAAVGRGTVRRRFDQFIKAAHWFDERKQKTQLLTEKSIKKHKNEDENHPTQIRIQQGSSTDIDLPKNSIDAIVTDPPYHDDVQYGELSALFRAWTGDGFDSQKEAVATKENDNQYKEQLIDIFQECRRILQENGHMILTYANKDVDAWEDFLQALDIANFSCIGYTISNSDNGTDAAKRGKKACDMDLLMNLVPYSTNKNLWRPKNLDDSSQVDFLVNIGSIASKGLSTSKVADWEEFLAPIRNHQFLN